CKCLCVAVIDVAWESQEEPRMTDCHPGSSWPLLLLVSLLDNMPVHILNFLICASNSLPFSHLTPGASSELNWPAGQQIVCRLTRDTANQHFLSICIFREEGTPLSSPSMNHRGFQCGRSVNMIS